MQEPKEANARRDLADLFCQWNRCPPSEFVERAFRKCLPWQAWILAPLVRRSSPSFFDRDLTLIRYLGTATGRREVRLELEAYREANLSRRSLMRNVLLIRVSGSKAAKLANWLFEVRDREMPQGAAAPVAAAR